MTAALAQAPARYLAVGALCAAANNLILIAGDASGLHYAASLLLTFLLVLPASYLAHAWWTFRVPASWTAFGRFIAGSISSLVVATLALGWLCGVAALPMIVAAPAATVAMIAYNYVMTRWAVRHRRRAAISAFGLVLQRDAHDVAETA